MPTVEEMETIIQALLDDHSEKPWNRNPTLLLQAADMINQLRPIVREGEDNAKITTKP